MEISIIIPCKNEGRNVEEITARIALVMGKSISYELIFVDDSDDDTPLRLEWLQRDLPYVRYRHREGGSGLGTAILDGFELARGQWFIVMDADLQHPPESLLRLISEIRRGRADLIVPSRFVPGGSDGGLNRWRKLVSWTARSMARLLLHRVRHVTDPTSGYFAVRRETAFSKPLDPIGWKLLLELLVRADYTAVREIAYSFQARDLGSSKFNLREQWNYVRHLFRLVRDSENDRRFWVFCLVGGSGVIVNTAVYVPLVHYHLPVSLAFACATLAATVNNFIWNNLLTWKHRKHDRISYRFMKFFIVSLLGLGISSLTVTAAHDLLGIHYLISGFIGIGVSTGWNYLMNNRWTFGRTKKEDRAMTS